MKKITARTSSFRKIIESHSLYVDKTKEIYTLLAAAQADDAYYFLARPRRFGKTLLISTLEELFAGNRDLFKGLWIDSSDYSWEQHPVVSLNFSRLNSTTPEKLEESLAHHLNQIAKKFSIDLSESKDPGNKLMVLVEELAKKNLVVILIDEYDYPIINNVGKLEVMQANLEILKNFFTAIKGLDSSLHALFITGVSQIPKASIFSGLNNLENISLDPIAAPLLGYTKEELSTYFSEAIDHLAQLKNTTKEHILETIQYWYNGYRFSEKEETVYNPFSLHYLFKKNKFENYWYTSGTPTFLLELLKKNEYVVNNLENIATPKDTLSSFILDKPQLAPLLFQTGYLTIASYEEETNSYTLAYPNHEVKESYNISLLATITKQDSAVLKGSALLIRKALMVNDMEKFCSLVGSVFAHIPYQIDTSQEAHYHSMLYAFILLLDLKAQSELSTNKGRVDMVVYTDTFIYVFEIKVNTSPQIALKQIEDRMYYEQFLEDATKRTIVLVGLAFNKKDGGKTVSCASKTITTT